MRHLVFKYWYLSTFAIDKNVYFPFIQSKMWKDREVILGELPPLSRQTSISIIDERWSDHFRIHQWRGRMNISQCIRTFLFDQYHTWYLSQAIHVPYRTFVCTNFEYTENYTKHQSYAIYATQIHIFWAVRHLRTAIWGGGQVKQWEGEPEPKVVFA